jgi:hypothetical protein
MFGFFKKNVDVPEWAHMLKSSEYTSFIEIVQEFLDAKNLCYDFEKGVFQTTDDDIAGLAQVAQEYATAKKSAKKLVVTTYLDILLQIAVEKEALYANIKDFEIMKEFLRVRILGEEFISMHSKEDGKAWVYEKVAEGAFKTLVFHKGDITAYLTQDEMTHWGVAVDELFNIAQQNTVNENEMKLKKVGYGDGELDLHLVDTEHNYAANILLDEEAMSSVQGKYGSLVTIPYANLTAIYEIDSTDVLKDVAFLGKIAHAGYHMQPEPITDKLYWYKDGEFIVVNYVMQDGNVHVVPSKEIVDLLNTIAADAQSAKKS